MKRLLITIIALIGLTITIVGCSKGDQPKNGFDYPMETLYGTWRITHVEQTDGTMFNVTSSIAELVFKPTYATFNEDGTYSGRGEYGSGHGTYKAQGKTITCFVDGEEYLKYEVLSLAGTTCELRIRKAGSASTLRIKCQKQ